LIAVAYAVQYSLPENLRFHIRKDLADADDPIDRRAGKNEIENVEVEGGR
jgi:hypothetical protein